MPTDPRAVLQRLHGDVGGDRLRHVVHLPARPARHADWPAWVHPAALQAWQGLGIEQLWSHQRQMADLLHDGRSAVVATGTSSGKSLGFLLPALTAVLDGNEAPSRRGATALYLAPTKALAADQLSKLESWSLPGLRAATFDGDTPVDERRWAREHGAYVLTNPDMVHHSLLPSHQRWAPFLRALRYVVIDECHVYRGVFGSHLAALLRRLRRVAAHYGADPVFALASATIGEPADLAQRLIGMPVIAVTEDGSPRQELTFALWQPPLVQRTGASGEPVQQRRSTLRESADLLAGCVAQGVQALAFARSRAGVEVVAASAREQLAQSGLSEAANAVAAYRGGYLPEERRALERAVRCGGLRGLAATNALELGVDINGLDAVIMAGWPGTQASLWQQAGRAGRGGTAALAVLVAADDPLDSWLMNHPETVFGTAPAGAGRSPDAVVFDPANPHVLAPHLACAAAELPLTIQDERWFGPSLETLAEALVRGAVLRRRPTGWYWAREDRASSHVSLRSMGEVVQLVEASTGRVVGTVDEAAAHAQAHAGAVHLHQGETYVVRELDLASHTAQVVRGDPGWMTQARSVSSFEIAGEDEGVSWGAARISLGRVRVRSQVTSFLRRLTTGEVLGEHALDLPERVLSTKAIWWTLPEDLLASAGVDGPDIPGALHAAEHASIGVLPLLATADRWDIGGVSTALHPGTGLPTVMVYDGFPGGAGFAERGYRLVGDWLQATWEVVSGCRCTDGCPACVMSPKCGNGNEPLSRAGAAAVLELLISLSPSMP